MDEDVVDYLRSVVDSLGISVYWLDKNNCYLGGNKYYLKSLGLTSPNQLVGQSVFNFTLDTQKTDFIKYLSKVWK